MRIALYARKSTESEDRQIQSLDDQLRALLDLAEREHLNVVEILQESKSAKAPGIRPEFIKLLEMIEQGSIDGILTWSINRLSRNPVDGGQLAYLLQTGKLSMIRTIERTYLPDDNALLMSIENGMATAYLQDLKRNVKRGMQGKVDRGWHTNKAPIGYLNNVITKEIDIDPERFHLVKSAWNQLLQGESSVAEVYRTLVKTGLTVPSRQGPKGQLTRTGFYGVFKNSFYAGDINFRGQRFPGRHVPMITRAEFMRAQEIISRGYVKKTPLQRAFVYAGVFTCGKCGCAVVGERRRKFYPKTGRYAEYIYYHCSGSKGCSKIGIRQEHVTEQLERLCAAIQIPREFGHWLKLALASSLKTGGLQADVSLESVAGNEAKLKARRQRLTLMRLDNEILESEFQQMKSDLDAAQKELDDQRLSLETTRSRILQRGHDLIDAAVAAHELPGDGSYLSCLGGISRRLGTHTFSSGHLLLKPHEIYRKIAVFEPPETGFQGSKQGDLLDSNSFWWGQVDDILNLLVDEDTQRSEERMQALRKRRVSGRNRKDL